MTGRGTEGRDPNWGPSPSARASFLPQGVKSVGLGVIGQMDFNSNMALIV